MLFVLRIQTVSPYTPSLHRDDDKVAYQPINSDVGWEHHITLIRLGGRMGPLRSGSVVHLVTGLPIGALLLKLAASWLLPVLAQIVRSCDVYV